jgi:hypothetical protein
MPHYISTAFYHKTVAARRRTQYDSFSAGLGRKLTAIGTTHIELETLLREHNTTIERLEARRRWPTERGQDEREEEEPLSKDREEGKVSGKSCRRLPIHI